MPQQDNSTMPSDVEDDLTRSLPSVPDSRLPTQELISTRKSKETEQTAAPLKKKNPRWIFWLISMASATGGGFYGNFFSAFAARVGVTGALMGFLTSIRNLLSSVFQGLVGRLSDVFGRKFLLLIGFTLCFGISLPLIFLENTAILIVVAVIQALAISIIIPTWNATLGDVTEVKGRSAFIGKITALGSIVSVCLTLIVALVFYLADKVLYGRVIWGWEIAIPWRIQYSIAFTLSAMSYLLCILAVVLMQETKLVTKKIGKRKKKQFQERPEVGQQIESPRLIVALKDKTFLKFLVVYSLFGFAMSTVWPLNPIIQIDILDMSFSSIAVLSASFAITMSISQIYGGKLGDRIGRRPLIIGGAFILVLYPAAIIPAIFTNAWPFLILANVLAGIAAGSFFVNLNAYALDLAPEIMMGAYSGLKEMAFGLMTFTGSLCAGFIIDVLANRYGYQVMALSMTSGITILRFIAAFGFLLITESLPEKQKRVKQPK
ncbi:MAG: MFS transporter [Candidatus Heimdallarchaeota archaeon]|nr:MFS transporter [Candidatus Heimdallarchaeota archaeon]